MKNKLLILTAAFAFPLVVGTGCKKDKDFCSPSLNLDKMEENLHQALDNQVMGHAYVISQGGTMKRSDAWGLARSANDGEMDMTIHQRMQVASCSKTITTVAVLSILNQFDIDPETSVSGYFPANWVQGAGISNISFNNLLDHSSGLNNRGTQGFNATLKDSLKLYISQGASQPETRIYANSHHSFFRIILPTMLNYVSPTGGEGSDQFYADAYKEIVNLWVFSKIGIATADCKPPATNPMLAYSSASDLNGSGGASDFSNVAGAMGWNLSAYELAKFWAYLWFTEDLIPTDMRTLMKNSEAGLWNSTNGSNGRYYCKLGSWNYGGGDNMSSCMMHFPDGTQVVIYTNSPRANGATLSNIARTAYDNAYGCF